MASESKTAIVAAILGNLAIAAIKFTASFSTGSAAMLSEAIHSLVDTGNGGLMLFGLHKSRQPPDAEHPFGHGRELYFWTLIVAILIFAIGGGMSVYEGIIHLYHPVPIENPMWNYAVLGFAIVFEAGSWYFGWKAFSADRGRKGVIEAIHSSKDPASFSVLLEDTAAVLGLVIAFLGVFLGQWFGLPLLDGAASVCIGLMLCAIAVVLVYESKGLLVGEGVDRAMLRSIRDIVERDRSVERVHVLQSLYLGAHEAMLVIEIRFHSHISARDIRHAVRRINLAIKHHFPDITRIFFGAESITEESDAEERNFRRDGRMAHSHGNSPISRARMEDPPSTGGPAS